MKHSIKKGFSFGLTSGIITTLGLLVGLWATTGSKTVVIGGVLLIAIADAMSDSLGIHISEESEDKHTRREIWEATISTFFSKFIFACSFIIPLLLFRLDTAIIVSVVWGLALIAGFSYYIAKAQKIRPHHAIMEHLLIAIAVIVLTRFVGEWISTVFA